MASSSALFAEIESVSAGSKRHNSPEDVVCCLKVPNCLLQRWHAGRTLTSPSYLELLNSDIRGGAITVDVTSKRLEQQVQRRAGEVAGKASKTKPYRARQSYLDKATVIDICSGEVVSAAEVTEELVEVNEQNDDWMKKCEAAEKVIAGLRTQVESCSSMSQALNLGLPIDQVGERQRRRKLSSLRQSTLKALWFVESFGLQVQNVTLKPASESGKPVVMDFEEPKKDGREVEPPTTDALAKTLYLLERFGV